jgi:GH15 family glucan-1,4-alpha-glucosidase
MSSRIEDYALIGDCQTAALVSNTGSIDWLCVPRFDSGACFAALLGTPEHGRWLLAPVGGVKATRRQYRGDTLILETDFETETGAVTIIDFMPLRSSVPDLVRIVVGRRGQVAMHMEMTIRFDYGHIIPWVRRHERGITAIAGPDMLSLRCDVEMHGENFHTVADFTVSEGQRVPFDLTWYPSNRHEPAELNTEDALSETERWWHDWAEHCTLHGEHREVAIRSLITLKALTYSPTGGIVAAPTTSLPEKLGGVRNWDYRYGWLRDSTFTLYSLMEAGFYDEAREWRAWLLRAVAGKPADMQIMYGLSGERRLTELELPWLPGYENSSPVRIGNAAGAQFQLDVYGEVMDSLHQCRRYGIDGEPATWQVQCSLMKFLESHWSDPDEGIWEVRGPRRQFTHSKVMAWVGVDRAVKSVEQWGLKGPVDRWRSLRDQIHEQVCREGFDRELGSFVQSYGCKHLDSSLLMIPLVGFLPPDDVRVKGTVAAIEKHLLTDGFVSRYDASTEVDGLPPGEATFLLCTFWLADNYALMGRETEARDVLNRLLAIRNDVGLLSEAYDVNTRRLLGNFPQAFSHVGLVNTVANLQRGDSGPAGRRQKS